MTFPEQTPDPAHFVQWSGDMEGDYVYTMGVAGERFFRRLMDDGEILAATCVDCETTWLPPRIYCPSCMRSLEPDDFELVEGPAAVRYATAERRTVDGETLADPEVLALIGFPGIEGGLLHRVLAPPEEVTSGLEVQPVLKPEDDREGLITDIEGFEPV